MALRDLTPVIDNRSYEDIVEEALTRIPRHTAEWTDFNPGDPGMALIELFAWMSEMMIFRMGQTPALNYVKFLELIGLELRPAQPARAEVSFAVRPGFAQPTLSLPERTQVSADGPVIYETERSLTVLSAELTAAQIFDGYSYRDISAENADLATAFFPFGTRPERDAALLLGFTYAGPFPAGIFTLTAWSKQGERMPSSVSFCDQPAALSEAPARVIWEYFSGTEWRQMTLLTDDTLAFTRTGEVRLRAPAKGEMSPGLVGRISDQPRYWIRARIEAASYDRAPEIFALRHNTVTVVQAETARDEVLGGSDGTMGQVLRLANRPVLENTLHLEIYESAEAQQWTHVDDFFASGPNDRHYVLNRTTGEVTFGDGDHGRIPVANPDRPTNSIVARHYRFGGGTAGNAGPGAIRTLLGAVPGLDANRISNPFAAYGGKEEETLAEAELRVPHRLRGRNRAVTAEDFEQLAIQVDAVRRAKALPLFNPECPDIQVPGAVTVIVVPDSEGDTPVPSDQLIRHVCAHLDQRRLLTTELYVRPPVYVDLRLSADLVVETATDPLTARDEAEAAIREFLDPFSGGEAGSGWPIGGMVYYSGIYRRLLVPGVQRVVELTVELNGETAPPCSDVPIPHDALIRQLDHQIKVITDPALTDQRL
jgi:predicted phage baseplate assembly protein